MSIAENYPSLVERCESGEPISFGDFLGALERDNTSFVLRSQYLVGEGDYALFMDEKTPETIIPKKIVKLNPEEEGFFTEDGTWGDIGRNIFLSTTLSSTRPYRLLQGNKVGVPRNRGLYEALREHKNRANA